jgi:hypothetical protein
MLQKILVEHLSSAAIAAEMAGRNFPLSYLSTHEGVTYTSAIAPMIDAHQSQEAVTLANQLAIRLRSSLRDATKQAQTGSRAIADYLQVEANHRGWLKLTLAEPGIAVWLDSLQSINTSKLTEVSVAPLLPLLAVKRSSFPLCDRLQLSLPMLLKWAYARCHTLIETAQPLVSSAAWPTNRTALAHQSWQSWTNESPAPCHELLKAAIQVADYLAAQPADDKTFLNQGYALASAMYRFDAALPTVTIRRQNPAIQVAMCSTLRATKIILALICVGLFGKEPPTGF